MLFTLIAKRYEHRSLDITSNLQCLESFENGESAQVP